MKALIYVTLKEEVLDPQGNAVQRSLRSLQFDGVSRVRVGKLIEVDLDTSDRALATRQVQQMGDKLLANPVMEDFRFDLID